jgi:hypothetical protein
VNNKGRAKKGKWCRWTCSKGTTSRARTGTSVKFLPVMPQQHKSIHPSGWTRCNCLTVHCECVYLVNVHVSLSRLLSFFLSLFFSTLGSFGCWFVIHYTKFSSHQKVQGRYEGVRSGTLSSLSILSLSLTRWAYQALSFAILRPLAHPSLLTREPFSFLANI